jgi:hypothetical protein
VTITTWWRAMAATRPARTRFLSRKMPVSPQRVERARAPVPPRWTEPWHRPVAAMPQWIQALQAAVWVDGIQVFHLMKQTRTNPQSMTKWRCVGLAVAAALERRCPRLRTGCWLPSFCCSCDGVVGIAAAPWERELIEAWRCGVKLEPRVC